MATTMGDLSPVESYRNFHWAVLTPPASGVGYAEVTITVDGEDLETVARIRIAAPFLDVNGGYGGCAADGNVRVRVVDELGAPVAGAFVMIGQAESATAFETSFVPEEPPFPECADGFLPLEVSAPIIRHYGTVFFDEQLRGSGPGVEAGLFPEATLADG